MEQPTALYEGKMVQIFNLAIQLKAKTAHILVKILVRAKIFKQNWFWWEKNLERGFEAWVQKKSAVKVNVETRFLNNILSCFSKTFSLMFEPYKEIVRKNTIESNQAQYSENVETLSDWLRKTENTLQQPVTTRLDEISDFYEELKPIKSEDVPEMEKVYRAASQVQFEK